MSNIKLENLSQEDREALRAQFAAEAKAEQVVLDEKEKKEGAYVFTNALNGVLMIPDLGIATPGGAFECESFAPFETKNLAEIYEPEELRKSKYLRMLTRDSDGRLLKGRVDRDSIKIKEHPLAILARNNPNGIFHDPTSATEEGQYGTNVFDQKLKDLHDRDKAEDMATRKH